MRCVGGVQSMLATHDLLLTDAALMGLLGFTAYQVEHGATARGLGQRTAPVSVRGAFSYETVADSLVAISPAALVELFNGTVRCLARQRVFAKHLDVVLDATDAEAPPSYQTDDGRPVPRVVREKRPEVRANRHAQKVEVTVYGWKLWIVWEPQSKIPLAMAIDDIEVSDNQHAHEAERRGQDLGITRYRRALERANRDKVVVFIGNRFGIFRSYEFALLVGGTVKERALLGDTVASVLRRYGVLPPDTS
jgi:hypothetical protein